MTAALSQAATRVTLEDVRVRFGRLAAVDGVSLEIAPGEIAALVGPSGCGKTTTLRAIAGLQEIDAGRIAFDGRPIEALPAHRRGVGMVFQSYALFPHMTAAENVAFGLRMAGIGAAERARRAAEALDFLRIGELAAKYPDQISGGQQQRVALARTLAARPAVLLLDEPLSALDRQLRDAMRFELRRLVKEVGITAVMVTHDQDEALTVADKVAVMNRGRIEQYDSPDSVYARPATRFVAEFVGRVNLLPGTVADAGRIRLAGGAVIAGHAPAPIAAGAAAVLALRPETIRILAAGAAAPPGWQSLPARIEASVASGGTIEHRLAAQGATVAVIETRNAGTAPALGAEVVLAWPAGAATILPSQE